MSAALSALQATTAVAMVPAHQAVEKASFTLVDLSFLLGLVIAVFTIIFFFRSMSEGTRKRNEDDAQKRADLLTQAIRDSAADNQSAVDALAEKFRDSKDLITRDLKLVENRVDKLDLKAADFRPGKMIDEALGHVRTNLEQRFVGTARDHDKLVLKVETLNEKVIKLETKHDQTAQSVSELKSELKETRSEINHRFDAMGEQQKQQFDQLCASIREVRDTKPRS